MLDRAGFSPGIIDGTWGKNAASALKYFRAANGMDSAATRTVDKATYDKLAATAPNPLVKAYQVTADDMEGPFLPIPEDVYAQAKLKCLCYSSPAEALAESSIRARQCSNSSIRRSISNRLRLGLASGSECRGTGLRPDDARYDRSGRAKDRHIEEGLPYSAARRLRQGCRAFPVDTRRRLRSFTYRRISRDAHRPRAGVQLSACPVRRGA